jgi:hypothetical protein
MKIPFLAFALLALGVLFRGEPITTVQSESFYALDALPSEIKYGLIDHFDDFKALRKTHPEFRKIDAEIITDQRSQFDASCTRLLGQAGILFTKAVRTGKLWTVHYEYGGITHGRASVTVIQQGSSLAFSQPVYPDF